MRNAFSSPSCLALLGFASIAAHAQTFVCTGAALAGAVRDPNNAIISGARVTLDGGTQVSTNGAGQYLFVCVAPGRHQLKVTADGFADATLEKALSSLV